MDIEKFVSNIENIAEPDYFLAQYTAYDTSMNLKHEGFLLLDETEDVDTAFPFTEDMEDLFDTLSEYSYEIYNKPERVIRDLDNGVLSLTIKPVQPNLELRLVNEVLKYRKADPAPSQIYMKMNHNDAYFQFVE